MKIRLLLTSVCLAGFSLNVQAGDSVPEILSSVGEPIVVLTEKERTKTRGEWIRSPAHVHAVTYCNS